jgi:hypothetical protein
MCSPPTPSVPEINPYEGLSTDPEFEEARKALGIDEVDREWEVTKINTYLAEQKYEQLSRDPTFQTAESQLFEEGLLTKDDISSSVGYINSVQSRQNTIINDEAYEKQIADQEASTIKFQEMMREEAAKNNFQAQRGAVAPVLAPVVQPKPIPVAPPTPRMEIQKTPPPPMLTQSENNMAIVRQPNTARTRQRQRSRGTASLSS